MSFKLVSFLHIFIHNTIAAYRLNVDCCKSFIIIFYFCCFRCVIVPLTGVINYVVCIYICVLLPIFVTWQGEVVNSRIVTEPTLLYFHFYKCGRWNLITNWYQSWLLGSRNVTILTIQVYATSSFTWPFESQWAISYWWSIGSKSLSPAVFEVFGVKHIQVRTLGGAMV